MSTDKFLLCLNKSKQRLHLNSCQIHEITKLYNKYSNTSNDTNNNININIVNNNIIFEANFKNINSSDNITFQSENTIIINNHPNLQFTPYLEYTITDTSLYKISCEYIFTNMGNTIDKLNVKIHVINNNNIVKTLFSEPISNVLNNKIYRFIINRDFLYLKSGMLLQFAFVAESNNKQINLLCNAVIFYIS